MVKARAIGAQATSPAPCLAALSSRDFYVRRAAMQSLIARSGEPGWLEALVGMIVEPKGGAEWAPYHAMAALARIAGGGEHRAIEVCLELVGRAGFEQELGSALQDAPEAAVGPALAAMLEDPSRRAAAERILTLRSAARLPAD